MAAYEKREVGLEERHKHANSKAEKLKRSLQEDENARNDALRSIQENTAKTKSEKRKVDQYEEELQWEERALEGIRDGLEDKTEVFRDRIEQKQKELQPWKTKVDQKKADVDVKTSERDMLVKTAEALEQASTEAHEALAKVKSVQTVKIRELENLKNRELSLQRVQDLTIRVNQHRAQASSTRQRVEEANASQAASASANEVLDSLMRLRDSGRVSGLHGRLGSLGTIPDEYDVAITTACGSLNDMVADTAQQGQACIEYLREQNVGRAGLLVLEEIDETDGMRPIRTPENVPRLFDLVEPKEPRFAHAFYEALRDTLVAQDLAQANRIAFGARRWRVVTLAGELIDSSGTMSGGGPKPRGGGMGSKLAADAVPPDVLQKYEQDSEVAAAQLTVAMEELRATEAELEAVGESGPQINLEMEKVNLDIQDAGKRVIEAEKRVHDLRTPSEPDAGALSRIASLEREIATARNQLEGLRSPSGTIEEAIKAIEREILDIGGSRLLAQKSKVDRLKLHIDAANEEITKAEVAMAKAERDLVKFEGSIASNRQRLAGVEIELGKLSESLREVEAARAEVENSKADSEGSKVELDREERHATPSLQLANSEA
ncbi:SMCs flexible hinge [Lactarius pseudohatsudake]|nr:SMCs flexible hinge [Lactarius pseudohatsudake]